MGGQGRQIIVPVAIALLGILLTDASLAKQTHSHHAHAHNDSAKAAFKEHERTPKAAKSIEKGPADNIDTEVSPPSRSPLTHARNGQANPNLKVTKPERLPPHLPGLPNRVVRNAIGQPVTSHEGPPTGGQQVGSVQTPSVQFGPGRAVRGQAIRQTNVGEANAHVVSVPNTSKISGTAMIRPSPGTVGLGGPSKLTAGVGGTVSKPRH